eukprot:1640454-Prymnesium_polylepis.2
MAQAVRGARSQAVKLEPEPQQPSLRSGRRGEHEVQRRARRVAEAALCSELEHVQIQDVLVPDPPFEVD